MATSRADSNEVGGTKPFMHTVDNHGDREMSMFVVSTVKQMYSDVARYISQFKWLWSMASLT